MELDAQPALQRIDAAFLDSRCSLQTTRLVAALTADRSLSGDLPPSSEMV